MMKGTDAGERSGITWAISNADHPGAVLMKVPKRAQSNSATYVTLKMSKVFPRLALGKYSDGHCFLCSTIDLNCRRSARSETKPSKDFSGSAQPG